MYFSTTPYAVCVVAVVKSTFIVEPTKPVKSNDVPEPPALSSTYFFVINSWSFVKVVCVVVRVFVIFLFPLVFIKSVPFCLNVVEFKFILDAVAVIVFVVKSIWQPPFKDVNNGILIVPINSVILGLVFAKLIFCVFLSKSVIDNTPLLTHDKLPLPSVDKTYPPLPKFGVEKLL